MTGGPPAGSPALHRGRVLPPGGDLVVLAAELGHPVGGPQGAQRRDVLGRPRPALRHDRARAGELLGQPPDAKAQVKPPAGQHVHGRRLLGHQQRRGERMIQHRHSQPDRGRHRCRVPEADQRVQRAAVHRRHVRPVGDEQSLERPQRLVAERLGLPREAGQVLRGSPGTGDGRPDTDGDAVVARGAVHEGHPRVRHGRMSPETLTARFCEAMADIGRGPLPGRPAAGRPEPPVMTPASQSPRRPAAPDRPAVELSVWPSLRTCADSLATGRGGQS